MEFTAEQVKAAYENTAPKVREFLDSEEIANQVTAIGRNHGLRIDELGALNEEIVFAALGLRKISAFEQKISERVKADKETLAELLHDINEGVFSRIRSLSSETTPVMRDDSHTVSRDHLLNAIENPAPTEHPISIAQAPAAPAKTRPASDATTADFVAGKLSGQVTLPSEQKKVPEQKPLEKKYVADPYREAIN